MATHIVLIRLIRRTKPDIITFSESKVSSLNNPSSKTNYLLNRLKLETETRIIKMFENAEQKIPIYVNLDHIVRYHFGVFSFTGGGKSCLLSNVLRRILLHTKDTKIVIFDISSEYPFLLMDLLADPTIPSKVVLESRIKSSFQ